MLAVQESCGMAQRHHGLGDEHKHTSGSFLSRCLLMCTAVLGLSHLYSVHVPSAVSAEAHGHVLQAGGTSSSVCLGMLSTLHSPLFNLPSPILHSPLFNLYSPVSVPLSQLPVAHQGCGGSFVPDTALEARGHGCQERFLMQQYRIQGDCSYFTVGAESLVSAGKALSAP